MLFLVGFAILLKGSGVLITGASSLAQQLRLSTWFIGIVIVGIGTSIPELSISFASAFNGVTIGLGTIIGSNTFNIFAILGIAALLSPLALQRSWVLRDLPVNIAAILLAAIALYLPILGDPAFTGISRPEGIALLASFLVWMTYLGTRKRADTASDPDIRIVAIPIAIGMVVFGILGVIFGGRWVVEGGEALARAAGASEAFIGLTVIGIGTSLPELIVSVRAALRRNAAIAVGNIVGSNVFDFLGIFGLTAAVRPIPVEPGLAFDILITALSACALFAAMFVGKRYVLGRLQGFGLLSAYLAYFLFLLVRG